MKRILITGADSYIGVSLEKWLKKYPNKYLIDTIDMRSDTWKEKDFSKYDVVFHVAGIAHVSANLKMKEIYYKVNRDLAIVTAKKAKLEGVGQFVFMSSIIVYGESNPMNYKRIIGKYTEPEPTNFYGKSKLEAEKGIMNLIDDRFKVVVLRAPTIYGKGSKGIYPKLSEMAQKLSLFPDLYNERSVLHIDNLCEFIKLMINNEESGLFFPQNGEYVHTKEMVKLIAEMHGNKIRFTKAFNPILRRMGYFINPVSEAFGNLAYEEEMSEYKKNYRIWSFKQSIRVTEQKS